MEVPTEECLTLLGKVIVLFEGKALRGTQMEEGDAHSASRITQSTLMINGMTDVSARSLTSGAQQATAVLSSGEELCLFWA